MQPVSNISKTVHVEAANPEQNLENYLSEAKSELNLVAKRAHYEAAFQIARTRPQDDLLFRLFLQYATETCYGQAGADGDADEGFRKAASLLELSVVLQLTTINTGWEKAESLDALVSSLGFARGINGKYFQTVDRLQFDPRPSALLADTFIRLSFSYQNIDELTADAPKFHSFHKRMDDFTNALIGDDLEKREDFAYNRARFMVRQGTPNATTELVDCYIPVLALTEQAYKGTATAYKFDRRLAQVENMRGIYYSNSDPSKSEEHFRKAIGLYLSVIGKYPSENDNFETRFLLSNARWGLCKSIMNNLSKEKVDELKMHLIELKSFYKELRERDNNHSYYQDEQNVDALLTKLGVKL